MRKKPIWKKKKPDSMTLTRIRWAKMPFGYGLRKKASERLMRQFVGIGTIGIQDNPAGFQAIECGTIWNKPSGG